MNELEILAYAQETFPEYGEARLERIEQAGSDRIYYRLVFPEEQFIICYSDNIEENNRFISLSDYFFESGISVPEVVAVHDDEKLYIQTDAGDTCLLDKVLKDGHTEDVKLIYEKVIEGLFDMQLCSFEQEFESLFEDSAIFGEEQVRSDLNYFLTNFLKKTALPFDEYKLNKEFDDWAVEVGNKEQDYFMYRDCQGRNIMLQGSIPTFIDFQGGMQGHPMYDMVSLLWQAKARLPKAWKAYLLNYYLSYAEARFPEGEIDAMAWKQDYQQLTLTRLLQVLGAYGLRGLQQGKAHFISSIPLGLENLREWQSQNDLDLFPELDKVLKAITHPDFIQQFKSS